MNTQYLPSISQSLFSWMKTDLASSVGVGEGARDEGGAVQLLAEVAHHYRDGAAAGEEQLVARGEVRVAAVLPDVWCEV